MENTNTKTAEFITGQTYTHRWVGDSDLLTVLTCVKRTKCFASFENSQGEINRCKIKLDEGQEFCRLGDYSMAPIVWAENGL